MSVRVREHRLNALKKHKPVETTKGGEEKAHQVRPVKVYNGIPEARPPHFPFTLFSWNMFSRQGLCGSLTNPARSPVGDEYRPSLKMDDDSFALKASFFSGSQIDYCIF